MATPLGKVRGLGSARRGTETFWLQRLTAVANVPLVIFLIVSIVSHIGADYGTVRAYLAQPLVALAMLALVISASIAYAHRAEGDHRGLCPWRGG